MSELPTDPVEPVEPAPPTPEPEAPTPVEDPPPAAAREQDLIAAYLSVRGATRIPTGRGALTHLSRREWAEVYRSPVRTRGRLRASGRHG